MNLATRGPNHHVYTCAYLYSIIVWQILCNDFFMLIKYLSVCLSGTLGTWSCLGGESPKHAHIHYRASKRIYCCGQFIAKATWAKPSAR